MIECVQSAAVRANRRRDAVGIQLSDNVPGRAYNVITLNKPSPGPLFNSNPLYLFPALHFESGPLSN